MQSVLHPKFLFTLAAFFAGALLLLGCGGGSSAPAGTGVPKSISASPTALSMNPGQAVQLSATLLDANSNAIGNTAFTYAATGAVQVSNAGLVCAGTWDSLTTPVICTPGPSAGTGSITITASGITLTIAAAVHPRIARVTVTTTAPAQCNSQGETQSFSGKAFDANGTDITAQAGPFTFISSNANSVTIDSTGVATSVGPGGAFITAANNGVFSIPTTFTACQPLSVVVTPAGPLTLAAAGTQQLTATVIDTKGNPYSGGGLVLSYSSSNPSVATVNSTGLITAVAAGWTGIEVSCTPPTCNGGVNANIPVYGNLVTLAVSGSSSTTVYATGATATSIIPIDTTTTPNTAGTAIAITQVNSVQPTLNSMVFSPNGNAAYIGSDLGMYIVTTSSNTLSRTATNTVGKVLAVSNFELIYADQSASPKTYVYNIAASAFTQLSLSTSTTAAAFSPDGLKAYLVSGGQVWAYSSALAPPLVRQITSTTTANDATFLTRGSVGYVGGATGSAINAYATCDNSLLGTLAVPAAPLKMAGSFDSTHVFGVDSTSIDDVSVSNIAAIPNQNCPVTVTESVSTTNFGQGTFTPDQVIVSPDGAKVYVLTSGNKILTYTVAGSGTSAITLVTGTAITTGGITNDGQTLYVGATGTNDVHKISGGVDSQQIAVSLKDVNGNAVAPAFVGVRPK